MTVADGKYGGAAFPEPDAAAFKQVLVDVPQVAGLSLDAAKQAIEAAGFVFEQGGEQDSNLPAGTVSGTDPTGQAGRGTTIRVFVSNGKMLGVPDVIGLSQSEAEAALKQAGFKVKRTEEDVTDAKQDGIVLSQSPGAGESAKSGDEITIVVGKASGNGPGNG